MFGVHPIKTIKNISRNDFYLLKYEYAPRTLTSFIFLELINKITLAAAIVSREMKKPCLVGVRHATELLKDGDLVEVDANQGFVRILQAD